MADKQTQPWLILRFKIGAVFNVLAIVVLVVGFSTPYWARVTVTDSGSDYFGLWTVCSNSTGHFHCLTDVVESYTDRSPGKFTRLLVVLVC